MTWKNEIKKNLDEEYDFAAQVLRYAMNELKIKDSQLETVLNIAIEIIQMNRGEAEEERRADSRHMAINER